ncbi:adenosylhomocysteinase [Clostridia bacterium]|nr:adenosylhomocysteinase [Clostridia bacterium]
MSIIRETNLWQSGLMKIDWVKAHMPLLNIIGEELKQSGELKGLTVAMSIHMEAKTARLALMLKDAGADVYATGSNPLSTQDDVCAALAHEGVNIFAVHGASAQEYESHLTAALSCKPDVFIDDGGDFVQLIEEKGIGCSERLIGGCEETTTGVHRLRSRVNAGKLSYPMFDVNDARCKHLFDNRYGTGQSVWDAITHTTNLIIAGSVVVVAGYGWCGKGVAMRAKGLGARVIITEVDPVCALEAHMDGFDVMPMADAAPIGDVFVTVTGCRDIIGERVFELLKDGAILSNAGHFDVEVEANKLRGYAVSSFAARENIEGFKLPNGRTVYLLAEGRLVNLAAGNGHPAEIMDMSFAIQALTLAYLTKHRGKLTPNLYAVPEAVDDHVARLKLRTLGKSIDQWTDAQRDYILGI